MHQGMLSVFQGFRCTVKHAVDQLRIGACPNRPTDQQTIETIHHGRKIYLPSRDRELCYVRDPFDTRRFPVVLVCTKQFLTMVSAITERRHLVSMRSPGIVFFCSMDTISFSVSPIGIETPSLYEKSYMVTSALSSIVFSSMDSEVRHRWLGNSHRGSDDSRRDIWWT